MSQKRGKHLLNSLESAVEDNLHGYVSHALGLID